MFAYFFLEKKYYWKIDVWLPINATFHWWKQKKEALHNLAFLNPLKGNKKRLKEVLKYRVSGPQKTMSGKEFCRSLPASV